MLLGQETVREIARETGSQPQPQGLEEFKRRTALKLDGVQCPDHRQPPRLKFRGASLRDVTVELSGCCGKLIEMANRAIAQPRT